MDFESDFTAGGALPDIDAKVLAAKRACRENPGDVTLWREAAQLIHLAENDEEAAAFLKEAISLFPEDGALLMRMILILTMNDDQEEAIPYILRLPGFDETSAVCWNNLFAALLHRIREASTLVPYARAAVSIEDDGISIDNLLVALIDAAEYEDALSLLMKNFDEHSAQCHAQRAICLLHEGRTGEAKEDMEKAISMSKLCEEKGRLYKIFGDHLHFIEDLPLARAYYKNALKLTNDITILGYLGEIDAEERRLREGDEGPDNPYTHGLE